MIFFFGWSNWCIGSSLLAKLISYLIVSSQRRFECRYVSFMRRRGNEGIYIVGGTRNDQERTLSPHRTARFETKNKIAKCEFNCCHFFFSDRRQRPSWRAPHAGRGKCQGHIRLHPVGGSQWQWRIHHSLRRGEVWDCQSGSRLGQGRNHPIPLHQPPKWVVFCFHNYTNQILANHWLIE